MRIPFETHIFRIYQYKNTICGLIVSDRLEKTSMSLRKKIVVKSNNLVSAVHSLSLTETRLVQMAIVTGREEGKQACLNESTPIKLYASDYAKVFDTNASTAFEAMKEAQDNLFKREFTMRDEHGNKTRWHWVQSVKPIEGEAAIEILFTKAVCQEVTRRLGDFTMYRLEQTAGLKSAYSVRLYELLSSWRRAGKFYIGLDQFRDWLGLAPDKYKQMHQFKARVLDQAVSDINDNSDMTVSYTQRKAGRRIAGFDFNFSVHEPEQIQPVKDKPTGADPVFNNMSLSRIADYAQRISTSSAGVQLWGEYGGQGRMQSTIISELMTLEGYQKWLPDLKQLGHQELI